MLYAQWFNGDEEASILRQLAGAGEDAEDDCSASLIHDAVLGKSGITVSDAVLIQPHHINTLDDQGFAPLHLAVLLNDQGAVETLASLGADVNHPTGYYQETPLHLACQYHREAIVLALLGHGASSCARDVLGRTPLHSSVDNPDITRHLLRLNATQSITDHSGLTPLRSVVSSTPTAGRRNCFVETLKIYEEAGASLDEVHDGFPLVVSAAAANPFLVQPILELGAKAEALNRRKESLLHYLTWHPDGMRDTIGMPASLLKGLDPDGHGIDGDTPLGWLKWSIVTDSKPRSLFRFSLGEVVHFVELILELRELNWETGLFLESKEKFERDGSHARMKAWAQHQRRLFMLDEDNRSIICNEHNVDILWDNYPSEGEEEEDDEDEDGEDEDDEDEDEDEFFDAVEN